VARGRNRRTADRGAGGARRAARLVSLALPTVLSLAAIGGLGWVLWRVGVEGSALRIRELRISGAERVRPEELRELSPVRPGDHLLLADVDALAAALRRNPWIATVEVRRAFPPALEIAVTERRAAVLVDLGGLYLADARGRVFKRASPGDGLDLPVITGLTREAHVSRREEVEGVVAGALALLERWRDAGLERLAPVSEVHVDPGLGLTVVAGEDGMEIRLGQGDLPAKLERLSRVLGSLAGDGLRAEVVHLDNRRHPDWVAVRVARRRGEAGGRPVASAVGRGPRGP